MNSDSNTESDETFEGELTILNPDHREIAAELLPKLQRDMDEREWDEFTVEVQQIVVHTILSDLKHNLSNIDWKGKGFLDPQDYLNAEYMTRVVMNEVERTCESDQTSKYKDVMQIIIDEAEDREIIERDV